MDDNLAGDGFARCLIISANTVVSPYPVYPLGSAYVVKSLADHGHQVSHFDLLADGGLEGLDLYLTDKTFDLVGISIRNIDSVDSASPYEYLNDVAWTIACIRKNVETVIVLGGAGFSIMPETLLEYFGAEYGVVGEGERVVPWLASEIAAGRTPEQRLLKAEHKQCGGGWPALSARTINYYAENGGMLNIQTKRGCLYNCAYCSYPTIEGTCMRFRDPDDVAEEALALKERHGGRYLFFADSVFNDPQGHYLEIAEALIKKDVSLPWCAFFRPGRISREEMKVLRRSGLAAMEIGTDGATDTILASLHKGFRFSDVQAMHDLAVAEGVPCAHFIMFGGPGEDEQTVRAGLKNIEKLAGGVVFGFVGIRILPGTKIFDRAVSDGIIAPDQQLIEPCFYYSPRISRDRIERMICESFGNRIERVYPCHSLYDRIAMLHNMGHVGPLWDLLLKN